MVYFFFFFFKQKTAYEMRISDWSLDVCSSELLGGHIAFEQHQHEIGLARHHAQAGIAELADLGAEPRAPLAVVRAGVIDARPIAQRRHSSALAGDRHAERQQDVEDSLDDVGERRRAAGRE